MHPAFRTFVARMDGLVESTDDPSALADGAAGSLGALIAHPEALEPRFRVPGRDGYRQHVTHVHPQGAYSIVSLVWLPGQSTPIHDHRCWCVVGVLEGREREERFTLHDDDDDEWLAERAQRIFEPGQICRLVPPDEDIHRVVNVAGGTSVSLHVYGADIAKVGTSINREFDLPIRETGTDPGTATSWRDRDERSVPAR